MIPTNLENTRVKGDVAEALYSGTARAIFKHLDTPRRKSASPIKPLIVEVDGTNKSGKNTTLVEVERWFNRRSFRCFVHQESAESELVRSGFKISGQEFEFEMAHFAYNFTNLIRAMSDRNYHLIFFNRGIFDQLFYLEWRRRIGTITKGEFLAFKNFAFSGEWIHAVDVIVLLTCSVEEALRREYGRDPNYPNVIYGSRMNPKTLTEQLDCARAVKAILERELPHIPLAEIDTTGLSVAEVKESVVHNILAAAQERLTVSEDEIFLEEPSLMREGAILQPPEIKIRGTLPHDRLRSSGWSLDSATTETDIYLTKKGVAPLTNDECYHLRRTPAGTFFIFKWGANGLDERTKIAIPIPPEMDSQAAFNNFDQVVTLVKKRIIFRKNGLTLSLDSVDLLGDFIEIKGANAKSDLSEVLDELGLEINNVVPESYLRMYLKQVQS